MRRIQAAAVILALLAAPLALVARGYACAAQECTMVCCRGHRAMKMNCARSLQSTAPDTAQCTMNCGSQAAQDYGLASPMAMFLLSAGVELPEPQATRKFFVTTKSFHSAGHSLPPFQPPRA